MFFSPPPKKAPPRVGGDAPKPYKAPKAAGKKTDAVATGAKAGASPAAAAAPGAAPEMVIVQGPAQPAHAPSLFESIGNAVSGAYEKVVEGVEAVEQGVRTAEKTAQDVAHKVEEIAKPYVEMAQEGAKLVQKGLEIYAEVRNDVREVQDFVRRADEVIHNKTTRLWTKIDPYDAAKNEYTTVQQQVEARLKAPAYETNVLVDGSKGVKDAHWSSYVVPNTGPDLIDQNVRGVCGPTSVMHAFASWDPDGYRALVKEISQEGRVKGRLIGEELLHSAPGDVAGMDNMHDGAGGMKNPKTGVVYDGMPQVDFMTICSLTNTIHQVANYDGQSGGESPLLGANWKAENPITLALPEHVAHWMKLLLGCVETKIVATISPDLVHASVELPQLLAQSALSHILRGQGSDQEKGAALQTGKSLVGAITDPRAHVLAKKVSELQEKYGGDKGQVTVTMCINAERFLWADKDGRTKTKKLWEDRSPDHYVRLKEPMTFGAAGEVEVVVHSWGKKYTARFDETDGNRLEDSVVLYVVGARTAGLLDDLPGVTLPDLGITI